MRLPPHPVPLPNETEGTLRGKVYLKFAEWDVSDDYGGYPDHLADILGYKGIHKFNNLITSESTQKVRTLEALASPNGYTIYKMLLARQK